MIKSKHYYKSKYEKLNDILDGKINLLRTAIEENGDSFFLHKEIKKYQEKFEKTEDEQEKNKYDLKLADLKIKKQKVSAREKNVYLILKKIEKIINRLDNKRNHLEIKVIDYNRKITDCQKDLQYMNDPKLFKEKIKNIERKIAEKEKLLKEFPDNIAIKVEIYQQKKKLKKVSRKRKKLAHIDKAILNKKIREFKTKQKFVREKSLKVIKLVDNFLILYKEAKHELNHGIKKEKLKSFVIENLNIFYGQRQALFNINLEIPKNSVIAIIGPSGCGKSTFLRTLNRINDEIANFRVTGKVLLDGEYDIYKLRSIRNKFDKIELTTLRTKVGMIFQQPNPFPMSVYKNVSYGPRINGIRNKSYLNDIVKESLKKAALWEEVNENLNLIATSLSGGQQQRLCIARAIANNPEILLMDEPTSALDPLASFKIENLILELKKDFTIIMVTHSLQQAARISDYTAFFYNGKLIEFGETKKLFSKPTKKRTDDYIRGKFG